MVDEETDAAFLARLNEELENIEWRADAARASFLAKRHFRFDPGKEALRSVEKRILDAIGRFHPSHSRFYALEVAQALGLEGTPRSPSSLLEEIGPDLGTDPAFHERLAQLVQLANPLEGDPLEPGASPPVCAWARAELRMIGQLLAGEAPKP